MQILIHTLVDITETNRNRNDKSLEYKQQSNFNTLLQTVGLKANPLYDYSPVTNTVDVKDLGFGSSIKGEHTVWNFTVNIEHVSSIKLEDLYELFNLLPINIELSETAKINKGIFYTQDKKFTNITFKIVE
jgi:hypothetical protein